MIQTTSSAIPQSLAEFLDWESTDGYKYEWYNGELIRSSGLEKKQ